MRHSRRHGLTLIELLLVLAILVILASVVTVSAVNILNTGSGKAAKAQISAYEEACEAFYLDMGYFPEKLEDLRTRPGSDTTDKWGGPYVKKEIAPDPWGTPYTYEKSQDATEVIIRSAGPDRQPNTDDDIEG